MAELLKFILIGCGTGALYALIGQGIVLVYRSSGLVNFGQGAMAMVGGYAYYEFRVRHGMPGLVAIAGAIAVSALLGSSIQILLLRPMRRSSALARMIVTLGVLVALEAGATLRYSASLYLVPSALPTQSIDILGAHVGLDRLTTFVIGGLLTIILWAVNRFTVFGLATSAVAENQEAAESLGHSADLIAAVNWGLGGAAAGLAGALIVPIAGLNPSDLVLVVLPAIVGAMFGGFQSFPIAFAGCILVGSIESVATEYITTPGWSDSIPFLIIIGVLIVRGRPLPLRSHIFDRLPVVGTGSVPSGVLAVAIGAAAACIWLMSPPWAAIAAVTLSQAILCLSVVVVTGYCGQISLSQYVLGGIGAFVAAKCAADFHVSFLLALLFAAAVSLCIGAVVGLPALRTRGVSLAIVSLGFAVVIYALVLSSTQYSGGPGGISVPSPEIDGWSVDPTLHPNRYAFVCLTALVIIAAGVANIRRGRAGRRLLAVRANERAAASLGVNVYGAKLYAFMCASGIASIGGTFAAFIQPSVIPSQFDVLSSIDLVTVTVVGGVGHVGGALLGASLLPGGIGARLLQNISIAEWLPLIGALNVLWILRSDADGLFALNSRACRWLMGKLEGMYRRRAWRRGVVNTTGLGVSSEGEKPSGPSAERVRPVALEVEAMTVTFGAVQAVTNVSFRVEPGSVHGLIGPNGAGKTTVIDAITGFVSSAGRVMYGEEDIAGWSPRRRSRAGISRSFQSLELFGDLTVRENLAIACDAGRWQPYLSDFVRPGKAVLNDRALAAVEEFDLWNDLDVPAEELPFGRRRLVAIARAVVRGPSIVLLDEPAAGLDGSECSELSRLIRRLAEEWGLGVLLVEHNVDMVAGVCDRLTVLVGGRTLLTGSPGVVLGDPAVLEAYIGSEKVAPVQSGVMAGPSPRAAEGGLT